MTFGIELRGRQCDDPRTVDISEGDRIVLRREKAGWRNQGQLAKAAGVSRSSVWKIENDKNVEKATYDAVIKALEQRERSRGIRPALSSPPATTNSEVESAITGTFETIVKRLANQETALSAALAEIRLIRLALDRFKDDHR